jgi:ATP-binding cassette subfamily F protein uup
VALVRALLDAPDVLLLDEPTNHLDADAVEWLQGWLAAYKGAVLLVTHDRYLLEAVATRIVEVEDGETTSYEGSYADYLLERAERRAALQRAEDSRLSMIAREAEWASRSPAAQTVKQKARLDRLSALMAVRPLRKEEAFSLDLRTGLKHGGTVLELHRAKVSRGGKLLFKDVELALRGGDRIGILGPNGAGKSTMLKILQGKEPLDAGEYVRGPRVRAAVLDQERSGLNLEDTVWEAAGGGNDQVRVGDTWVHVASFLGRFLFGREAHGRRVKDLSGGERARLLLAKLLLQGANLLMLDEPTNDLDLQTLRVLEEALLSYDGVVIVVTHDRAFLDRVCNAVIAFEPGGVVTRYASRQQALAAQARRDAEVKGSAPKRATPPSRSPLDGDLRGRGPVLAAPGAAPPSADASSPRSPLEAPSGANRGGVPPSSKKLSFKEQKELNDLPARIDALEKDQARLGARLADSATYRDGTDVTALAKQLAEVDAALEAAMERWAELASRS